MIDCAEVHFSGHALRRMFERALGRVAILEVIHQGEVIAEYPDDRPYPSWLVPGFSAGQPVHLVPARDPSTRHCYLVTAYRPEPATWSDDFKTRRDT